VFRSNYENELIQDSHDLSHLGIKPLGWKYEQALKVLIYLNSQNCIILGGDVYRISDVDGDISVTYDNWYYEGDDVDKSLEVAQNYINNYHKRNGESYCYSIVYKSYNI